MAIGRLWSPVEVRREIAASPDAVWAVLSEPCTYPEWLVGAQRIRSVDPRFPAAGTTFQHAVGPSAAVTVHDSTDVLESEPRRRIVLLVHVGPLDGRVELELEEQAGGTSVSFRELPLGAARALTPLLRPALHSRNEMSLRKLEELVTDPR